MRQLAAAVLAALIWTSAPAVSARQTPVESPRNANYTLQAALDPGTATITGSGLLTWRNVSPRAATSLRFHLYWNAWRDPSSTWLREQQLGRNPGLARRPPEDRGQIDLTTLALITPGQKHDLLGGARFVAPDDGNADDKTVLEVTLDRAVASGDTIQLELGWTAKVPRTYARTGRIGRYFFVAQWFPKIGVLDAAGWNTHQFHAATEFFSDFGVYDVSLTVPRGWVVGATGREQWKTDNANGTTTHRYLQADVHDFAWTTSPDFVERRERFEAPGLPPVEMRLLLQPEHVDQADRHFRATRTTLKHYGTWFGPYPYSQITIVDPVTIVNPSSQGESTGGMEYPTLFTAGTRWFAPWMGTQPEAVTVHEAGHQFWYGAVATNEFEHAWMDEGLNTYATARAMAEDYPWHFVTVERYFGGLGFWAFTDAPWSRDIDGNRLNAFRPVASFDDQSTPTWKYWPGSASAMTYNKTALWLATLEKRLGWPTVQKILATHYARGLFRHPTPEEFFAIANDVSGEDLTWFFDAVHRSSATFDYAVAQAGSTAVTDPSTVAATMETVVVVRRLGDGIFPVPVRVRFDDGSEVVEAWDGRERWHAFTYKRTARVASVDVDPARMLMLDVNYTNNSWAARPRGAEAASRWAWRWLTWAQDFLLTYAFFA